MTITVPQTGCLRIRIYRPLDCPPRLVSAVHEAGLIYQHHSCGYVEPILEDMAEIGVDAIDALQACNKNLAQIMPRLQDRLAFCGGFDNQRVLDVPGISTEAVKKEYRRVIDSLVPGGSYVIIPSAVLLILFPLSWKSISNTV